MCKNLKNMNTSKKIVLLGDAGVGKTTLIKHLLFNDPPSDYVPTLGVEVHPLTLDEENFNVWDCAGDARYGGLREGYYIGAYKCIIMHNGTINPEWERLVKSTNPHIQISYLKKKNSMNATIQMLKSLLLE
jgi:small GTP-binding protein